MKHPKASPANKATLLQGEIPFTDPVFLNIDEDSIAKVGAAGPSALDTYGWRSILVCRNFAKQGKDLRSAIARMTIRLCIKESNTSIDKSTNLERYIACRLIPLDKQPGITPIDTSLVKQYYP